MTCLEVDRAAAEELRRQLGKLTEQLMAVEDELSRLAITWSGLWRGLG